MKFALLFNLQPIFVIESKFIMVIPSQTTTCQRFPIMSSFLSLSFEAWDWERNLKDIFWTQFSSTTSGSHHVYAAFAIMWLIAQRLAAAPLRYFLNDGGVFLHVSKVAWLSLGKYLPGAFGRWWGDQHCAINRISKGCINNKSQQRIILVSTCFEISLEAKSAKTRRISLLQEKRRGGTKIIPEAVFWPFLSVCESALSAKQVD